MPTDLDRASPWSSDGPAVPTADAIPSPARLSADEAMDLLGADARRLLTAARDDAVSPRWATASFARQVDAVRRQLAPLETIDTLATSLRREAFLGPRVGRVPAVWASPVRVAYAVRWIELQAALELPPWGTWFG